MSSCRATNAKCPECGRSVDGPDDPVCMMTGDAACLRAQLARVTAERDEAVARWTEAEKIVTDDGRKGIPCGAWCRTCDRHDTASWSPRAKGYRCAECEEAGR